MPPITPNFLLTYAGVPFVSDQGKSLASIMPASKEVKGWMESAAEKHQSEQDMLEQINRLIELGLIQDQSYPSNFPGQNLSALAKQWPIHQWPQFPLRIGDWFYPRGMSRWSVFRGLATSSMVQAMLSNTQGSEPGFFVMQSAPVSPDNPEGAATSYTLETFLHMLPPRPLAVHGGNFDGLYLLTLVDERYYLQSVSSTLRVDQNTTWNDLAEQVIDDLGIELEFPEVEDVYGQPEADSQLWTNSESSAFLLDAIAYNVGRVVVRNLDGTYEVLTADESSDIVDTNRGDAESVVRLAGGDLFGFPESLNSPLPEKVIVSYPKYIIGDDPVPHFVNPRYQNQRPSSWYENSYGDTWLCVVPLLSGGLTDPAFSGLTGVSGYVPVLQDTAKAVYAQEALAASGLSPLNEEGLTFLAMQLAHDLFSQQIDSALDEVYPGTYAWTPEGIHDLVWTYSDRRRLAVTRVFRPPWNQLVSQFQHATPPVFGFTNIPPGVGGKSVSQTWRDSFSGTVQTTLDQSLNSGDFTVVISDNSYLPTQNRWYGQVDDEILLLEGTSGGLTLDIVQRGTLGTRQVEHDNASELLQITPDAGYGVNLVSIEKSQFVYPSDWKSGGIQGINLVPQIQIIKILSSGSTPINDQTCYSGQVFLIDTTLTGSDQFQGRELVWAMGASGPVESGGLKADAYYAGLLVGYSANTPVAAPVYDIIGGGGGGAAASILTVAALSGLEAVEPIVSGTNILRFDQNAFTLSGWTESGVVDVFTSLKVGDLSGDILVSGTHLLQFGSGFLVSGYPESGSVQVFLVSGSVGSVLSTVNQDGTEPNSGVTLLVAANDLSTSTSGYRFGRILFTTGSASGSIGAASGVSGATEIDWEGFRVYKAGVGYKGPEPDIEFIEGTNISVSIADSPTDGRTQVTISATASGVSLETINADGSQDTKPTTLLIAVNSFSGQQFGRIYLQNLGSSGGSAFLSGTIGSGQLMPNAAVLDWQGLRVYQEGQGYRGPEPDFELVDGSGIKWFASNDTDNQRIRIAAAIQAGSGLRTINQDGSQDNSPVTLLVADNDLSSTTPFGRILFTKGNTSGSTFGVASGVSGATQIDWQGLRVYKEGTGYLGPEPDFELVDGSGIKWFASNDVNNLRVRIAATVTPNLRAVNQDGSQNNTAVSLFVADNDLSSTTPFGRILFTKGDTSGTTGAASGVSGATQIDWQGLQVYHAGDGSVGPAPDIEFLDGSGTLVRVSGDTTNNRVLVQVNTLPTGGITLGYIDSSLLVSGSKLLQFDQLGFNLSGYQSSGSVQVFHLYGSGPDIKGLASIALGGTLGKVARADHQHPGPTVAYTDDSVLLSGTTTLRFDPAGFRISGTGGTANVLHFYALSGDTTPVGGTTPSPGGLSRVARADHQHNIPSGYINATNLLILPGMILSGAVTNDNFLITNYNYFLSGILPGTINEDGSQFTYPTSLIIAANDVSGYANGRLIFTNNSSSGLANASLIDWQGLEVYHDGVGFTNPFPNIEVRDGITTVGRISGNTALNAAQIQYDLNKIDPPSGNFTFLTASVDVYGRVEFASEGNPMTASGDLILGARSGAPTRLPTPGGTLNWFLTFTPLAGTPTVDWHRPQSLEFTGTEAGFVPPSSGVDGISGLLIGNGDWVSLDRLLKGYGGFSSGTAQVLGHLSGTGTITWIDAAVCSGG